MQRENFRRFFQLISAGQNGWKDGRETHCMNRNENQITKTSAVSRFSFFFFFTLLFVNRYNPRATIMVNN